MTFAQLSHRVMRLVCNDNVGTKAFLLKLVKHTGLRCDQAAGVWSRSRTCYGA